MDNIEIFKLKYVKEATISYNPKLDYAMSGPDSISALMKDVFSMDELSEEYLYLICFNSKNKISSLSEVSHGDLNSSIVSPREIFKRAFLSNASSIILVHNHPSGDTSPSLEDKKVTKRIKECGLLMGIPLLDHIIIGNDYYSFNSSNEI